MRAFAAVFSVSLVVALISGCSTEVPGPTVTVTPAAIVTTSEPEAAVRDLPPECREAFGISNRISLPLMDDRMDDRDALRTSYSEKRDACLSGSNQ